MTKNKNHTELEKYLFAPKNSHAKESLINNKLLFDLKLAAAERGYFLNAYLPEVDQDGFDIIFDDQDLLAKVQLKTVMKDSSTSRWDIHKRLLRPTRYTCHEFGFERSPEGEGYAGGVILMRVNAAKEFGVKYFYTDITILCGFRDSILDVSRPPKNDVIRRFFKDLYSGIGNERILLPKSLFLEAANPSALLSLMGLHSSSSTSAWRYHLMKLAKPTKPDSDLAAPFEKLKEFVNDELRLISPRIKSAP